MNKIEVCRCCLQNPDGSEVFCLFSTDTTINANVNLAELISDCTGLLFTAHEIESCFICELCRQRLLDFYAWKALVLDTNEQIRDAQAEVKVEAEFDMEVDTSDIIEEYLDDEEEGMKPEAEELPTENAEILDERLRPKTAREIENDKKVFEALYQRDEEDGSYHCPNCPSTFQTVGRLAKHLNIEHAFQGEERFSCKICGEVSPTFKYLKLHHDQVHKGKSLILI